jgi:hypothetical protein
MDDFFDSLAAPTTTTTSTTSGVPFIDPAADFLAQEQAELEKIGIDFNDQVQLYFENTAFFYFVSFFYCIQYFLN